MPTVADNLVADAVMSLKGHRGDNSGSWWAGWKRHYWPADMLRRGFRFYAYDKQSRSLFALVEVVRGRSFTYRTLAEFSKKVRQIVGSSPNRENAYWNKLPLPTKAHPCALGMPFAGRPYETSTFRGTVVSHSLVGRAFRKTR